VNERLGNIDRLEQEVGVLLRRIRRVIGERAHTVDPSLQPGAYLVLAHLAEAGPSRASAVVAAFDLDKGAVSRHVRTLVDLGLVLREPDPADGRATLLRATGEARRRLDDVAETRRARLDERLGDWTPEELRSFVDALARYNATLERD
jgi:DNA-binding MarR family transcriptional regulator